MEDPFEEGTLTIAKTLVWLECRKMHDRGAICALRDVVGALQQSSREPS